MKIGKLKLASIVTLMTLAISTQAQTWVQTFVGKGTAGFVNGDSTQASFRTPFGICVDAAGNIFLADNGNNCIRKITKSGVVTTYAGTGSVGYVDGASSSAKFNAPTGVCVDDTGNVYVSDFQNHRIRKINTQGIVSTIAGSGTAGYKDDLGTVAQFSYPRGISRDQQGNLYVGDSWNHRVRKIAPNGQVTTYAGGGNIFGVQSVSSFADGKDTSARFYTPCEVKVDEQGNVYVADAYNHRIRKIDANRNVTTIAGSGASGNTAGGFMDGPSTTARFNTPTTVFEDGKGILYVGDGSNQRVRRISTSGYVTTIAGTGAAGFANGSGNQATFNFPRGIAMSPTDTNLFYVVDYNNHSIRKLYMNYIAGVPTLENISSLLLYPNPNNGSFTLQLPELKSITTIRIWNTLGSLVYEKVVDATISNTIQLHNDLPIGIYWLEVKGKDFVGREKMVIKK